MVSQLSCVFATEGGCSGRLQWHHVLPRKILKGRFSHGVMLVAGLRAGALKCGRDPVTGSVFVEFPDELPAGVPLVLTHRSLSKLIADERNKVEVCWHHHQQVEGPHLKLPAELVPASVWEFTRELGLDWWLERHFGEERHVESDEAA